MSINPYDLAAIRNLRLRRILVRKINLDLGKRTIRLVRTSDSPSPYDLTNRRRGRVCQKNTSF